MKKPLFVLIGLILLLNFFYINVEAAPSNLYKNGIYTIGENNKDLSPGSYSMQLISKNSISNIFIVDKNYSLRFTKHLVFLPPDDAYSLYTYIRLVEGDTLLIIGDGDIYINKLEILNDIAN